VLHYHNALYSRKVVHHTKKATKKLDSFTFTWVVRKLQYLLETLKPVFPFFFSLWWLVLFLLGWWLLQPVVWIWFYCGALVWCSCSVASYTTSCMHLSLPIGYELKIQKLYLGRKEIVNITNVRLPFYFWFPFYSFLCYGLIVYTCYTWW